MISNRFKANDIVSKPSYLTKNWILHNSRNPSAKLNPISRVTPQLIKDGDKEFDYYSMHDLMKNCHIVQYKKKVPNIHSTELCENLKMYKSNHKERWKSIGRHTEQDYINISNEITSNEGLPPIILVNSYNI